MMTITSRELESNQAPYKGLEPFTEDDAKLFFGRNEERDRLIYSLQSSRLTVLYGARQVGKTSLLRAGVINHLRRRSASTPRESVVVMFEDWSDEHLTKKISNKINEELERIGIEKRPDPENKSFGDCCQEWAECVGNLFVVLDHFEDYLGCHPRIECEPDSFDFEFSNAISTRGLAINFLVAIRDDLLAGLDRYRRAMGNLYSNLVRLEPLAKDQAQEAILHPVYNAYNPQHEGVKVGIEAELVRAVLKSVSLDGSRDQQATSEPDALVGAYFDAGGLQLAMKAVWEWETQNGSQTLRHATFDKELSGLLGIAARYVEERFSALTPRERHLAARILDHLVTPGGMGVAYQLSDLAKRVGVTETELKRVTEKLENEGMVIGAASGKRLASVCYEMAHRVLTPAVLDSVQNYFAEKGREEKRLALEIEKSSRLFSESSQLDALKTIIAVGDAWLAESQSLLVGDELRDDLRNALQKTLDDLCQKGQLGGYKGAVSSIAYSGNGSVIVTGAEDGSVRLWNIRFPGHPSLVHKDKHKTWIWALRTSIDGKWAATGSDDGTVGLWTVSDQDLEYRRSISFADHAGASPLVRGLSFSAQGSLLAIATTDGRVRLWHLDEEKVVHEFTASQHAVRCVEFGPDGLRLATGADDGSIGLWDLQGNPLNGSRSSQGSGFRHDSAVWGIRFHPDGERLASCSEDHSIKLWNLKGHEEQTLIGHTCWVLGIRFNSDGSLLASASEDGTARIWDDRGNQVAVFVHGAPVNGVCFSPDDSTLATAAADCKVRLWNVGQNRGPRSPRQFRHPRKAILLDVSFSSDGESVATGATDSEVQIWDKKGHLKRRLTGHNSWIMSVVFHPFVPSSLATGCIDGTARVWNIVDGTSVRFAPADGPVWTVAFSPDGHFLATGSGGGKICRWDLRNPADAPVCFSSDRGSVWSLRFSPDGKWIAAGHQDGSIQIRDFAGNDVMLLTGVHEGQVLSVGFSPDGNFLASSSSEGRICVWDLVKQEAKWFHDLDAPIWSVCFSPDGQILASGSVDRSVCLWNQAGEKLRGYSAEGPIRGLSFSRDGKWLAGSCSDGTVRLWLTYNEDFPSLLARAKGEWENVRPLTVGRGLKPYSPSIRRI
jgi:WD40 repeat protein